VSWNKSSRVFGGLVMLISFGCAGSQMKNTAIALADKSPGATPNDATAAPKEATKTDDATKQTGASNPDTTWGGVKELIV
jgi:hypothetical protein